MGKRFETKRKIASILMAASLVFTGASGVMLAQLPVAVSAKEVIADNSSARSITVYKYAIKDSSELGEAGTGIKDDTVTKTPLEGIRFKVQRVTPIGEAILDNPLNLKLDTDYAIDTTFTEQIITTDATGAAKVALGTGNLADGTYLLTELEDNRTGDIQKVSKPADPFFVIVPQTHRENRDDLIYDVVVQPKNILESLINPNKTIEENTGYSIKAGQEFNWEATAKVPDQLAYTASQDMVITPIYNDDGTILKDANGDPVQQQVAKGSKIFADYFTITDILNQELELVSVKTQVRTGTNAWVDLDFGTDYTVKINDTAVTSQANAKAPSGTANKVVVDLVKPTGTENPAVGMEKVQEYDEIRVVYTTKTDIDFNGVIDNEFDVKYKSPGLQPVNPTSPTKPEYYTGGFNITKTTEKADTYLEGAVFHLADSEDNAKKNIFLGADGKNYGKTDGTGTVQDAIDAAVAAGTTLLTSTSDASGKAKFDGLKLNWFTDTNNNGVQDETEPTFTDKGDIQKDYWVVETQAPEGYELLKAPVKVTVSLNTYTDTIGLQISNKVKTDLPFTGGAGTWIVIAIALGSITVGAVAITIDKKRRNNA